MQIPSTYRNVYINAVMLYVLFYNLVFDVIVQRYTSFLKLCCLYFASFQKVNIKKTMYMKVAYMKP